MNSNLFTWLKPTWGQLQARRQSLPHALLIQGRAGLGKTALAMAFAQRLLCEGAAGTDLACGQCQACIWFSQGNHPDFRLIQPEALEESPPADAESRRRDGETASRQIRIDQVREVQALLAIGTHRRGLRVVLLRPAEAMNVAASNALLKSLEEPPPSTVFLLVSSMPDRLLPTVRSRCQRVFVPPAAAADAVPWLVAQGVSDPDAALAYAGNAPLAVLEGTADRPAREALLRELAGGQRDPLALADLCQGAPPVRVIAWLQKWVADLVLARVAGRARYHLRQLPALRELTEAVALERLLTFERSLGACAAVAQHPLNARLFLEATFISYAQLWEARHA
ncbi:MAG: DNA polymerase III subunit delta' [Burkholderiales bacterium]